MKVKLPRWLFWPIFSFVAFGFLATPLLAVPPSAAPVASHTTLVIFADHPLPHGEWPALFAALRSTLITGMPETRTLDPSPKLMRGDRFISGTVVQSPIVVFLHGDCALYPQPLPHHYGMALGWVHEANDVIQRFVDVNCTAIGRVLGLRAGLMKKQQRIPAMADALARVIVHEWIHIAEQYPGHARRGIAQASFSANEMLGGFRRARHSSPGIEDAQVSAPPANDEAAMVRRLW